MYGGVGINIRKDLADVCMMDELKRRVIVLGVKWKDCI